MEVWTVLLLTLLITLVCLCAKGIQILGKCVRTNSLMQDGTTLNMESGEDRCQDSSYNVEEF